MLQQLQMSLRWDCIKRWIKIFYLNIAFFSANSNSFVLCTGSCYMDSCGVFPAQMGLSCRHEGCQQEFCHLPLPHPWTPSQSAIWSLSLSIPASSRHDHCVNPLSSDPSAFPNILPRCPCWRAYRSAQGIPQELTNELKEFLSICRLCRLRHDTFLPPLWKPIGRSFVFHETLSLSASFRPSW